MRSREPVGPIPTLFILAHSCVVVKWLGTEDGNASSSRRKHLCHGCVRSTPVHTTAICVDWLEAPYDGLRSTRSPVSSVLGGSGSRGPRSPYPLGPISRIRSERDIGTRPVGRGLWRWVSWTAVDRPSPCSLPSASLGSGPSGPSGPPIEHIRGPVSTPMQASLGSAARCSCVCVSFVIVVLPPVVGRGSLVVFVCPAVGRPVLPLGRLWGVARRGPVRALVSVVVCRVSCVVCVRASEAADGRHDGPEARWGRLVVRRHAQRHEAPVHRVVQQRLQRLLCGSSGLLQRLLGPRGQRRVLLRCRVCVSCLCLVLHRRSPVRCVQRRPLWPACPAAEHHQKNTAERLCQASCDERQPREADGTPRGNARHAPAQHGCPRAQTRMGMHTRAKTGPRLTFTAAANPLPPFEHAKLARRMGILVPHTSLAHVSPFFLERARRHISRFPLDTRGGMCYNSHNGGTYEHIVGYFIASFRPLQIPSARILGVPRVAP